MDTLSESLDRVAVLSILEEIMVSRGSALKSHTQTLSDKFLSGLHRNPLGLDVALDWMDFFSTFRRPNNLSERFVSNMKFYSAHYVVLAFYLAVALAIIRSGMLAMILTLQTACVYFKFESDLVRLVALICINLTLWFAFLSQLSRPITATVVFVVVSTHGIFRTRDWFRSVKDAIKSTREKILAKDRRLEIVPPAE